MNQSKTSNGRGLATSRSTLALALLALVALNLAAIGLGVTSYPALFSQPGARTFVWEPVCALAAYAGAVVWIASTRGAHWNTILRTATLFGIIGGTLEILNIGIENGNPFSVHGPLLQIGSMLTLFTLWGVAGFRAARTLSSIRAGLSAAVSSAAICMLIAVAGGFCIQFFLAPPDPAYVSTWAEFRRSGWTDARAFGVANTLDAAFTHLVIAPVVAILFGGAGSWLAEFTASNTSGQHPRLTEP